MGIESLLVATSLGALTYFLKRFIDQFDVFEKEIKKQNKDIDKKLNGLELKILIIENKVLSGVEVSSLDALSKGYLKSIVEQVKGFNERVIRIEENYGQVVWLKNEHEKQNKKLITLFEVSKKLAKQARQGPPDVPQFLAQQEKKKS